MPIESGSLSLRCYRLTKDLPPDTELAAGLASHALPDLATLKEKPNTGWSTWRHLTDADLRPDTIRRGMTLQIHLTSAERKIPEKTLRQEIAKATQARLAADRVQFLPSSIHAEIRRSVIAAMLPQANITFHEIGLANRQGSRVLYTTAASDAESDAFVIHWHRSTGIVPQHIGPDYICRTVAGIDPRDLTTTNFSPDPSILHDLLSNDPGHDFLTWLWYMSEEQPRQLRIPECGNVGVLIQGPLQLVNQGKGAHQATLRKNNPAASADVNACLRAGKKLASAKLSLCINGDDLHTGTFNPTNFTWRGLRLAAPECPLDPQSLLEHRMAQLEQIHLAVTGLFSMFLRCRTNPQEWTTCTEAMRNWVANRAGVV